MMLGSYAVPERLEQLADQSLTGAAGHNRQFCSQRNRMVCQFLPPLAAARHGCPESSAHRNAEERRENVRPVVHILIKGSALMLTPLATNESNRNDIEQQRSRAPFRGLFGVENMCFPKR